MAEYGGPVRDRDMRSFTFFHKGYGSSRPAQMGAALPAVEPDGRSLARSLARWWSSVQNSGIIRRPFGRVQESPERPRPGAAAGRHP
eukprot:965977-Pyramimonas_sp.AAC.1